MIRPTERIATEPRSVHGLVVHGYWPDETNERRSPTAFFPGKSFGPVMFGRPIWFSRWADSGASCEEGT